MRTFLLAALAFLLLAAPARAQNGFAVEKLAEGVWAAIARPGGAATSNAFFVEGEEYVVAAGAHLTREAVAQLVAAVATVTVKPIRYFVLTHHHRGFSQIDFDFPPGKDVIMTVQTWQAIAGEVRKAGYPVLFFGDGLTLKLGERTLILTNTGKGHTEGDILLLVPEAGVLFASDLFYVRSVGYLGEGHMREWVLTLEFMEGLGAKKIVPGYGPVASGRELSEFKAFFKAFLTEVLRHIERGESLEATLRTFSLPAYRDYEGYDRFIQLNVERAYRQLRDGPPD